MITFEQFVKNLGGHAKHYTTTQLKQLHIDVRKMAQILVAIHKSLQRPLPSPQERLDDRHPDRTMGSDITRRGDGGLSQADQS